MIRLIVNFDFDCPTLKDSYRELRRETAKTNLIWETSDEAYNSDGEPIDPFELQEVILSVLKEEKDLNEDD